MSEIFTVSDFHYGHLNLCSGVSRWADKSGCRDFATVQDMNEAIIENVNRVVKTDDILWHLGDWSFGNESNILKLRRALRCQNIFTILGNHCDREVWSRPEVSCQFAGIFGGSGYDAIVYRYFHNHKVCMSHYPILSWDKKHKGVIHLSGHCHGSMNDWISEHLPNSKMLDCDIGGHPEFRPYHFLTEIVPYMNKKTEDFVDHHHA